MEAIVNESIIHKINAAKKEFVTDGYTMSVGEIISMYKEGELIINPDFQRAFRWSVAHQTRLIESILIGVPLPSIFVYQNEKAQWEVVDGVQRLSTILQFIGVLRDEENKLLPQTILEKTKTLPDLNEITWEHLPPEVHLDFKRARLEVKIIKYLSNKNAKFEVFQRLNWSAILSGQEYRNALLVMTDKFFYNWLIDLSKLTSFQFCIGLTDRWLEEKYDQELVLRLFIFASYKFNKGKIDDFINECIFYDEDSLVSKIEQKKFILEDEKIKFEKTFSILYKAKGESVFQKSDGRGNQFLESYYEIIAIGLYSNIEKYDIENDADVDLVKYKIENINDIMQYNRGTGSETRVKNTIPIGKKYFEK
ncbi:MAG: DUF262 domain-containing protein [Cytophagales bacterium]|nr:MAG: DUF262 domain-containing protein [Cytophagales bacterium]